MPMPRMRVTNTDGFDISELAKLVSHAQKPYTRRALTEVSEKRARRGLAHSLRVAMAWQSVCAYGTGDVLADCTRPIDSFGILPWVSSVLGTQSLRLILKQNVADERASSRSGRSFSGLPGSRPAPGFCTAPSPSGATSLHRRRPSRWPCGSSLPPSFHVADRFPGTG
jgi:hypothetical protein